MGDSTTVTLWVLKSQAKEAEALMDDTFADSDASDPVLHSYTFNEVNYGALDFLPALRKAGIAYDSGWDDGGEYTSGTEHSRYTPEGEHISKDIYDNTINPPLHELLDRLHDYEKLKRYIEIHNESISVPPLDDDQVTYGNLYRTKQLISPD